MKSDTYELYCFKLDRNCNLILSKFIKLGFKSDPKSHKTLFINLLQDVEDALDAQQNHPENWPERGPNNPQREPFKPLMDPEVVKEFLVGDYCLYGGSGWWKYEFCYGKKVEQYHQEGKERKTVITLGTFDKLLHLQWLKENPSKRPKPLNQRKHVSHFYSNGDICDVTRKYR